MIHVLFFLTGVAALALELAWTRMFVVVLGSTHTAIATVVAVYMAGLGIGSVWGGRLADRSRVPLRLFGMLLVGAGLTAFAIPWVLPLATPILKLAYVDGERVSLTCVRIAVAAILLLPPAILLGATLPALSRCVGAERVGARVGWLYAANTFGAALGTLLAGLWAFAAIGTTPTGAIAASADILIGLAAIGIARAYVSPIPCERRTCGGLPADRNLVVAALSLGLTGLAGMMLEIGWTRALVLSVGNSTYAFTIVLAAFVLGLALGGALGARLVDRIPRADRGLGYAAAGLAGFAVLSIPILGYLPAAASLLFAGKLSLTAVLGLEIAVAIFVVLPAALLSGACFPFACRLALGEGGAVGRGVGWIAGANTLGAVAGSLLAGFVILPLTGAAWAPLAIAALVLVCTCAWLQVRSGRAGAAAGLSLALFAIFFAIRPHGFLGSEVIAWHPAILASGPFLYTRPGAESGVLERGRAIIDQSRVLFYRDGPAASVAVLAEGPLGDVVLRISGKVDASTGRGHVSDLPTELLLGHLPMLLHPDPRRALTIGLGGGLTLGALLLHPLEGVDSVEISPDVVEAARRFFGDANGGAMDDPRVRTIIADARQHLLLSEERYDVITSEPSNPWVAGIGALFTEECFELCRDRLRPGGIMCQWIHATGIAPRDFRLVLRTFASVFPEARVWVLDYDCLLIGGEPSPDLDRLRKAFEAPALCADLRRIGIETALDFFQYLGPRAADAAGGGPIHRDDRPVLEFRGPLGLYRSAVDALCELTREAHPALTREEIRGATGEFLAELSRRREARRWQQQIDVLAYADRAIELAQAIEKLAGSETGLLADVVEGLCGGDRWAQIGLLGRDARLKRRLLALAGERGARDDRWLAVAQRLAGKDARALGGVGESLLQARAFARAQQLLGRAVELDPLYPRNHFFLGIVAAEQGRLEEARQSFAKAAELDQRNGSIRYNLGLAIERLGALSEAEEAYREALRLGRLEDNTHAQVLLGLARVITKRAGALEEAIGLVEKAAELTSRSDPEVLRYLEHLYTVAGRAEDAQGCGERIRELESRARTKAAP